MVLGFAVAVTAVFGTYQCAEMQRIALGLGSAAPIVVHAAVYVLWESAFIGLPCPTNNAGMGAGGDEEGKFISDYLPFRTLWAFLFPARGHGLLRLTRTRQ